MLTPHPSHSPNRMKRLHARTVRTIAGIAAVALATLTFTPTATAAPSDETEITFVVTQDLHGRINTNTVRWAGTIEQLRAAAEHSIFLSAGDNFGNSLYASSVQDEKPTVDVLNALELEATAVGNAEYFIGIDKFRDLEHNRANFPHLAANVVDATTGELLHQPYVIREVNGVRIGIIGVVTPDTQVQFAGGDPKFLPLIPALNAAAEEIEQQDLADITIALIHEGGGLNSPPATLADEFAMGGVLAQIIEQASPLIEVLFTAHSHNQYLYHAPIPGDPDGRTRPVIQAGAFGELLNEVTLSYDTAEKRVTASTARIVSLTDTPESELVATYPRVAQVKQIVDQALSYAEQQGNQPAGQVAQPITTAFSGGSYVNGLYDGGSSGNRTLESALGTLVGNMFRDMQREQNTPPQFGITIPNFIRSDLMPDDAGNVPIMKIIETFSIRDSIVSANITGAQLKTLFEQQWQRTPTGDAKGYIQLAMSDNLTYSYDDTRPEGDRITSIMLDGVPILAETTYRVGLSGALLIGIVNFHEGKNLTNVEESGLLDVEGFQQYFAELSATAPLVPSFVKHGAKLIETTASVSLGDNLAVPTLDAGDLVEFDVSSLNLTSLGAPENTTLTVTLNGSTVATVPVNDGAARVSFTIPDSLQGDSVTMRVLAQPSGTVVQRSFTVRSDSTPPPGGNPADTPRPSTPPSTPAATALDDGSAPGGIALNRSEVRAGDMLTIQLPDQYAEQWVAAWMFSTPVLLGGGWQQAAPNGTLTVKIPANASAGMHRIAVFDDAGARIGWRWLRVLDTRQGSLSRTGANGSAIPWLSGGAGLLLLAAGVGLVAAKRRRR